MIFDFCFVFMSFMGIVFLGEIIDFVVRVYCFLIMWLIGFIIFLLDGICEFIGI